jgi:hypothetical protein
MQVAVGLGRKTGVNRLTGEAAAFCDIFFNKSVDEVFAFGNFSHLSNLSLVIFQIIAHYTPTGRKMQQKNLLQIAHLAYMYFL